MRQIGIPFDHRIGTKEAKELMWIDRYERDKGAL